MLEVFTRINRAGVQVAGEDLFFAAVKTLWSEAEQVVARVVERLGPSAEDPATVTPLVGRLGALRTLARLAARAVGQADLVPLTVDRLSGPRGHAVINGMQTLSDPDGPPLRRMAATLHAVMRSSTLGFGLYSVDERLWDDVLGWAAVNEHVDDAMWLQAQLAIDRRLPARRHELPLPVRPAGPVLASRDDRGPGRRRVWRGVSCAAHRGGHADAHPGPSRRTESDPRIEP